MKLSLRGMIVAATLGVLVALAVGIAYADQPPTASPPATTATTVNTDGTWLVNGGSATAQTECPYVNGTTTWTTIPGADWIWTGLSGTNGNCNGPYGPELVTANTTYTFSTTFTVTGDPQGATLSWAADNGGTVYVNGDEVDSLPIANPPSWNTTHTVTILADDLVNGTNTISIDATNGDGSTPGADNPAGLVASLTATSTLTSTDLCKNGGWETWTTPTFKNQGDCVSYLVAHNTVPQS